MQNNYNVIGLMSGTSLDGLDLAHCTFSRIEQAWHYQLNAYKHVPYSWQWENDLQQAVHWNPVDLLALDIRYGRWLGQQVQAFLSTHNLPTDLVASHGHTVHHRPELGFTLQIGHGQALADTCQQTVINDFRTRDVLLGGQGAPLVPVGDQLLFSDYDICLNLGGFANISFSEKGIRKAYDIGMANIGLNDLSRRIGLAFDTGGEKARSGKCVPALLHDLDELPYYQLPIPKSTGYEWYTEAVQPLFAKHPAAVVDWMHTLTVHIASVIAKDLQKWTTKKEPRLLVTGGGAFNTFLLEKIQAQLGPYWKVVIPDESLISYKEAIVFGLLGVLRLRQEINCLASVTGAKYSVSGGNIYSPFSGNSY